MSQKNNKKKESVSKPVETEYMCPICKEQHKMNEICPIVYNKMYKIKPEQRVYILGNIILECIKRKVYYRKILEEIVYFDALYSDSFSKHLNASLMVNYFAESLGCSPAVFFKRAEKTIEEYAAILSIDYGEEWDIDREDSGRIQSISMPVAIYDDENNEIEDSERRRIRPYLYLRKENVNGIWEYSLYLNDSRVSFFNIRYKYQERFEYDYWPLDIDGGESLAIDRNGKLKEFFEKNFEIYWTDTAKFYPSSDPRLHIWIEKLAKATKKRLIRWKKVRNSYSDSYYGNYAKKEIEIDLSGHDENDYLYIKFKWDYIIGFKNYSIPELRELCAEIEYSIRVMDDGARMEQFPQKEIEYFDVIAVTNSMICKENNHTIISYKGLVTLLNKENEKIIYAVYVGYCKECKHFYMFATDFEKMLKEGKPLCKVIRLDEESRNKTSLVERFKYKSESVLHAMGYSVRANSNLNDEDRQKILIDAIDRHLLKTHEVLDFLNWLVRVNKFKKGHAEAVAKWEKDVEFIKNKQLMKSEMIEVRSITVRK